MNKEYYKNALQEIKDLGFFKEERIITTPQGKKINTTLKNQVLNMCANNYLGLANNAEIIQAAKDGLDKWGYGMSSVRFICGTQEVHKTLEKKLSDFLCTDDTILYSSCFDANGGLFETLLGEEDAIISDELNHASIIDGIRLCKAKRLRYKNNNIDDLETKLKEASSCRNILIATDGVFSMNGTIANLKGICDLADKYNAMVMVDDSHAVGFIGKTGKGSHEYCDVLGRIDILTGTFGKALGGGSGGYTSGRKEIIDLLRQRSRPYLFSNSIPPSVVMASLKALELVQSSKDLLNQLKKNTIYFRKKMSEAGFSIIESDHPIVAIMVGDAKLAQLMATNLLEKGIYVVGFYFPVVPKGEARIRVQISATYTKEDLDYAIKEFIKTKSQF